VHVDCVTQCVFGSVLQPDLAHTWPNIVLCVLQEMAPREYLVHMLLGRLYRRLGAGERALAAFSAALDLGPSGSDKAAIKAAMDRLNASDDEEEEEM
jgi:uncharacterized protein HemY